MTLHKEDYQGFASKAVDHVKAHPYIYGFGLALLLAFALGGYAFAAVTCKGEVPGTLNCVTDGAPPVTPPPVVIPPPSSGSFQGCPADAITMSPTFGDSAIVTQNFSGQILSIKVAPPLSWSSTSTKTTAWAEYGDAPMQRTAVLSTVPCSFDPKDAVKNGMGQALVSTGNIRFSFTYKNGVASGFTAGLTPGKVYYLNVRNVGAEAGKTYNMRGNLPQ